MIFKISSGSLSYALVNCCKLLMSTAGTEAMSAELGYFTAASMRVCKKIDCRIGFCSIINLLG